MWVVVVSNQAKKLCSSSASVLLLLEGIGGGGLCSWLGPGAPPHLSWVVVSQVSLHFSLLGILGLFDAPPQVSSGGAIESSVSCPKGQISSSDQGLDFLCHPGLSVWEDPDVSFLCDVFYTALYVEEDRLCVSVCVQVLMFKNAPLCQAVLQLGKSIIRPGFNGL